MARKLTGIVTSDVQDKTITVAVSRSVTHPVYGKRYSVTKKFAVHDQDNKAHVGDKVEITEVRPISKRKSFTLSRVIETGHAADELKDEEVVVAAPKTKAQPKTEGQAEVEATEKEAEK
jgi:small subunit ribosomal protein S17